MAWDVRHRDDLGIIETTLSGRLSGEELQAAAAARIALGEEKEVTNFLIDGRDLIAPRSATVAVYDIPTRIYVEQNAPRETRIAVVKPTAPESQWINQFYEDLCVNRGWSVYLTDDVTAALQWLQQPDA